MLTDSDKEHIREQEAFRTEVRKLLAPEKEPAATNRFWKFVNSPFALWLFSSVVLTAITAGFTAYFTYRKAEDERAQTIRKLTTEASYRIQRFESYMTILYDGYATRPPKAGDMNDTVPGSQVDAFYQSVLQIDKQGVFKELSDRTLRSILWEIESLQKGNQKQYTHTAFDGAQALQDFVEKFEDESVKDGKVSHDSQRSRAYFVEDLTKIREVLAKLRQLPQSA